MQVMGLQVARKDLNFSRMCFLVNCLKRFKSSQQWLNRQRADPYVEKAKMHNYRYIIKYIL